jgi:hypothetical protein
MEKKRLRVVAEKVRESMRSKEKSAKASERVRAGGQVRKEKEQRESARARAKERERQRQKQRDEGRACMAFASALVWLEKRIESEKRIENASESYFHSLLPFRLCWPENLPLTDVPFVLSRCWDIGSIGSCPRRG